MLRADGLTRDAFVTLWRDEMWHAQDMTERARLVLELGRLDVRDFGGAKPWMVAFLPDRDPPLMIVPLRDVGDHDHAVRDATRAALGGQGATEAYVLLTIAAGDRGGQPSYLLCVWGESADGSEKVCWLKPFRTHKGRLEEAPEMCPPDPDQTVLAGMLGGLFPPHH